MKKENVVSWIVFIVAIIALVIMLYVVVTIDLVHAQEGCGEWVFITTTKWVDSQGMVHHRECGWVSNSIECPDSVWIPKPCPEVVPPKQMAMKDTVYTDWMYADSIYIFHFGRKFVWKKEKIK